MQRPSEPRVTRLRPRPGGLRARLGGVALSVTVAVASLTPLTVRAAPIPDEAQQHYDRGVTENEAGRFAAAAAEFAAAYEGIPAANKAQRANVLFVLVEARRNAFAESGPTQGKQHPAAHLCAADRTLTEFIDAAEKERKGKGKRSDDTVTAMNSRKEIRAQIAGEQKLTPGLDCATVEFPPADVAGATPAPETNPAPADGAGGPAPGKQPRAPRKIDKPLVIAGGVLTGFGLAMFGLMAGGLVRGKRAEADGEALVDAMPTTPEEDPELQAIDDRGRSGNRMAIAGGVIGALALGTGIALLVVGLRGGRTKRVAVAPSVAPRAVGLTLRWQF